MLRTTDWKAINLAKHLHGEVENECIANSALFDSVTMYNISYEMTNSSMRLAQINTTGAKTRSAAQESADCTSGSLDGRLEKLDAVYGNLQLVFPLCPHSKRVGNISMAETSTDAWSIWDRFVLLD